MSYKKTTQEMNREERRNVQKQLHIHAIPMNRANVGNCYYCDEPVLVAEGQALKYFRGLPTHKKCR